MLEHEDYMPPIASYSYRVLFNFTPYRTAADYWTSRGKSLVQAHEQRSRIRTLTLTSTTQALVAGAATQDEKLKKIYAAIMTMENSRTSHAR